MTIEESAGALAQAIRICADQTGELAFEQLRHAAGHDHEERSEALHAEKVLHRARRSLEKAAELLESLAAGER